MNLKFVSLYCALIVISLVGATGMYDDIIAYINTPPMDEYTKWVFAMAKKLLKRDLEKKMVANGLKEFEIVDDTTNYSLTLYNGMTKRIGFKTWKLKLNPDTPYTGDNNCSITFFYLTKPHNRAGLKEKIQRAFPTELIELSKIEEDLVVSGAITDKRSPNLNIILQCFYHTHPSLQIRVTWVNYSSLKEETTPPTIRKPEDIPEDAEICGILFDICISEHLDFWQPVFDNLKKTRSIKFIRNNITSTDC
ncbi:hypothetical protein NEHOM01_1697 [Nematocida homosporus]|uniref:uncharacterized protein n=1 Tax=Nematocida homosporus TaxID=1912981 RepID=UPI00221F9F47|nr:uncharacterized protein NEHOM01_1697 [Nematocida homosporus]KAI5186777.1 hypothetical protein NEHOM01_1697 [Nematocida homosporus]